MPTSLNETILCRYNYDPLDRLADCTPLEQAGVQRYYCKSRLTTEIQGTVRYSFLQHDDQLLAQQQSQGGKVDTALLATDQQRSVFSALDTAQHHSLVYSPYGHRQPESGLVSLLGFTGQRPDPVTGQYHLGNGYRAFNPVLSRFHCPDSLSPFGRGGLNAYAYCAGDPLNRTDPTGHIPNLLNALKKVIFKQSSRSADVVSTTVAQGPARTGMQSASIGSVGPSSSTDALQQTSATEINGSKLQPEVINLQNPSSEHFARQLYIQDDLLWQRQFNLGVDPGPRPLQPPIPIRGVKKFETKKKLLKQIPTEELTARINYSTQVLQRRGTDQAISKSLDRMKSEIRNRK